MINLLDDYDIMILWWGCLHVLHFIEGMLRSMSIYYTVFPIIGHLIADNLLDDYDIMILWFHDDAVLHVLHLSSIYVIVCYKVSIITSYYRSFPLLNDCIHVKVSCLCHRLHDVINTLMIINDPMIGRYLSRVLFLITVISMVITRLITALTWVLQCFIV